MLLHDVRLAVRGLARRPAFAGTAILLLALGAGANAAVFSVVRGVLLRPLPFERPESLVAVWPDEIRLEPGDRHLARAPRLARVGGRPGARVADGLGRRGRRAGPDHRRARVRQPVPDARPRRGARADLDGRRRHAGARTRGRALGPAVAAALQRRRDGDRAIGAGRPGRARGDRGDARRLRSARAIRRSVGAAALRAGNADVPHHLLARPRAAARRRHPRLGVAGAGGAGPGDAPVARPSRGLGPDHARHAAAGRHDRRRAPRARRAAVGRRPGAAAGRREPRHAGAGPIDRTGARAGHPDGGRRVARGSGAPAARRAGGAGRGRRGRRPGAGPRRAARAGRRACPPRCPVRTRSPSTAWSSRWCWRCRWDWPC